MICVASSGVAPAQEPETAPAPIYMGRAFLFEADVERGVELGWISPGGASDDVVAAVVESLEERLRRSGKFVEAVVRREEGNRLAVVFVGPQSRGFEEFLAQALAGAGRIAYRVAASDEEGTGRKPASAGGEPTAAVTVLPWRPSAAGVEGFEEPVTVRVEPAHLLDPPTAEKLQLGAAPDGSWALAITLDDEGWNDLQAFVGQVAGRQLALTVDGQVVGRGIDPAALERTLVVEGGFTLEEIRPITFAFAGEPLSVPLRFLGTANRELPNVKHRDSPIAID